MVAIPKSFLRIPPGSSNKSSANAHLSPRQETSPDEILYGDEIGKTLK